MKALKKLAVFCVGAALTVGSAFGFAACDNGTDPQGYDDPNIREVYSLYVASAEESGNEPMTYEEWLASIKGKDGAPGKDGKNGKDGSSFLHGEGEPDAADGKAGDLYLDIVTGDLYEKTAEGWSSDPVGNLKGPQGEQGPKGDKGDSAAGGETEPADDAVKTWDNVTIEGNGTYTLDCKDVTPGLYWLVVETETEANYGVLTVKANTPTGSTTSAVTTTSSFDLYSPTTQTFKGILCVDETIASIEQPVLTSTSESAINAKIKLVEYKEIAVTAGAEIEIPTGIANGNVNATPKFTVPQELLGKSVTLSVITYPSDFSASAIPCQAFTESATKTVTPPPMKNKNWVTTVTLPTDALSFAMLTSTGYNLVIKIELATA